MPTCPNCGSIIMNGDPYCSHCGTTLRWSSDDDDDCTQNPLSELRTCLNLAKSSYDSKSWDAAMIFLTNANIHFKELDSYEVESIGENVMRQDWIAEICFNVYNAHGSFSASAAKFIMDNRIPCNVCEDCDLAYPIFAGECGKCKKKF